MNIYPATNKTSPCESPAGDRAAIDYSPDTASLSASHAS